MHGQLFQNQATTSEEGHWLSVTDLMAGLMVIFLLISVALMNRTDMEKRAIERLAVKVSEKQLEIHRALAEEFLSDFERWHVSFDEKRPLVIDFNANIYKFETGKSELPETLRDVLNDFFPRYLNVLEQYERDIQAIQIEGHTSTEWNDGDSELYAYKMNMALSQRRANNLFSHVMKLELVLERHLYWFKEKLAAIGYGPSKLIYFDIDKDKEDKERSRRISFRVIADSEIIMKDILESN
ncbi:OmpA family protein [Vibrio astriarenae]|uniref:OmpA family protein n=1 Tax=Vibrio astriarenae TaxID=1481923 RepID=A0A7Z2T742_9VIBR|nr:OmpA family protein [Vibrio astriarenae]QIA65407.1 OmpA family protein [Vibrio astriarenae]